MSAYKGPLYHGTDKRILRMNESERNKRLELCLAISDYSYKFLKTKNLSIVAYTAEQQATKKELSDIWIKFWDHGMTKYSGWLNNNPLYQYDYLYVSNSFAKAAGYAKDSFVYGERGDIAYWLYQGAKRFMGYYTDAPETIKRCIEEFEEILKEPHEPVVVVLSNIDKQNMKDERGSDIEWDLDNTEEDFINEGVIQSFRLVTEQKYDLGNLEQINVLE